MICWPAQFKRLAAVLLWLVVAAPCAAASERDFRLAVPAALEGSGLLSHLLPRFSLKMATRVSVVPEGEAAEAALRLAPEGPAVFTGPAGTWHLAAMAPDHGGVARFRDWLASEAGHRALAAYTVDGVTLYVPPALRRVARAEEVIDGDAEAGRALALTHCGRCHVVDRADRLNALGSTPSFEILRGLPDWEERFAGFFARNPHPAFTQIPSVTAPFAIDLPPPIVPLEITVEDLGAILAYVAGMTPPDLGAPLQVQ
ncbi:c-type cytochrome [Poseidonocella sedimentorum]|uniref:Cytochrome c domain-containing protein n=1 Tax=Poseidonocella sedimentorum TaxID=871652 RepID=A0A1I6D3R3_9RHOB|nr:cytochrome c [Poseidonocella sedimentorum]SFQ99957.1 hypothetical protein SAMN04515673_10260 [Poseidonocella sedimentorum]